MIQTVTLDLYWIAQVILIYVDRQILLRWTLYEVRDLIKAVRTQGSAVKS